MTTRRWFAVVLISMCAIGCASPSHRVVWADDLDGEVRIERPSFKRTDANLLEVNVPISNISEDDVRLLVQLEFLDENGSPYNDETNRRAFLVPRGSTKSFRVTSLQSIASDYVLTIWRCE